jgi:hypothetical protein
MEQGAAIKFCVKLHKTATESFETLKSTYSEECLLRTSVFKWHKGSKKGESCYKMINRKATLQLPE